MSHAMIDKSTPEQIAIAEEAGGWLIDAVAGATQDRQFLRHDPECNEINAEAVERNGVIASLRAIHAYNTPAREHADEMHVLLANIMQDQNSRFGDATIYPRLIDILVKLDAK